MTFIGYDTVGNSTVLELNYHWGTDKYEAGNGFGPVAIGIPDVCEATEPFQRTGGNLTRPTGPMKKATCLDR